MSISIHPCEGENEKRNSRLSEKRSPLTCFNLLHPCTADRSKLQNYGTRPQHDASIATIPANIPDYSNAVPGLVPRTAFALRLLHCCVNCSFPRLPRRIDSDNREPVAAGRQRDGSVE